ncbi:MAG: HesA/MoeB/ThiF family protein [Asticcacaulis sp.]
MMFSDDEIERYARHLILREIGGPGQQRLKGARVLIIGAGGIGSPAALYLAAAGVGTLGLVDADTVSLSNLQRQILFATGEVGLAKTEAAARRLGDLNPHVQIQTHPVWIGPDNAEALIRDYDLVLDGCDDFATRLCVNAACVHTKVPLVSAALGRWSGQVGVFTGQPCYQCLVPEIPPEAETCARVGVVGALAGVMGSMAALEAIKVLTGAGSPLTGRLMLYDSLGGLARTVTVAADPACPVCSAKAARE